MNSKSYKQTSPKKEQQPSQGRKSLPPMSLEEAIRISCAYENQVDEKSSKRRLDMRYSRSASGGYKRAQTIIKSERSNNEQSFIKTAKKLLDEGHITQAYYDNYLLPYKYREKNNLLDVTTPSPLKVDEQQPIERENMDERPYPNKKNLKLEFNDITDPVEVGKTILEARKLAGLSQNQLVANSNKKVSLRTLSKLESGKAEHVPQITTLAEIAKATGMKLKVSLEN